VPQAAATFACPTPQTIYCGGCARSHTSAPSPPGVPSTSRFCSAARPAGRRQSSTPCSCTLHAYDLRKLRGKQLVIKPGRTRRYQVPGQGARTIAALLTLRDQVIAPILAGVRRPGPGRPPKTHTRIDRDYETLRTGMRTLLHDLAIDAAA
jgi:hypothetical protein